jgi:hypothetical protein
LGGKSCTTIHSSSCALSFDGRDNPIPLHYDFIIQSYHWKLNLRYQSDGICAIIQPFANSHYVSHHRTARRNHRCFLGYPPPIYSTWFAGLCLVSISMTCWSCLLVTSRSSMTGEWKQVPHPRRVLDDLTSLSHCGGHGRTVV